jgi:hypothetical protein
MFHITESYQCPSLDPPKLPKDKSPTSKSKKNSTNVQKDDGDEQEENYDSDSSNLTLEPSKISFKSTKSKSENPDSVLDTFNINSTEYSIQPIVPPSPDKQQETLLLTAGSTSTNIPANIDPPQIECIACSDLGADTTCVICSNNIHKKCSVVDSSDICSEDCKEKLVT